MRSRQEVVFDDDRMFPAFSAAELAGIILFQPVKICRYLGVQAEIDAGNADEVANQMIELLKGGSKEAKVGTKAVDHVLEYLSSVKPETLQALAKVLEEKKYKTALEKLRNDPAAGGLLSSRQKSKNPIEEIVHDNWVFNDTVKALQRVIKSGVPYAGSDDVSTAQAVILVCAAYDTAQEREQSFNQVAEALDRAALLKLLEQLVYEKGARRCLGALARYGREGEAARLISEMPKLRKNRAEFECCALRRDRRQTGEIPA